MLGEQQLEHLGADALARQLLEPGTAGDAGAHALGVGQATTVHRMEAEEPQDAQIVLGDPGRGIADEAHAARLEVGEPADVIVERAVSRHRQRIHREVAALRIAAPVAAERHLGVAAESLDVLAQRGDLERRPAHDRRDGTVLDAGRHRLEARRLDAADDLVGQRRGGDVEVAMRRAEQRVTHRAADHARFLAVAAEHGKQLRERLVGKPAGIDTAWRIAHLVCPGTNTPSS